MGHLYVFRAVIFVRLLSIFSLLLFFSDLLLLVLKTVPKSLKFIFKYSNIPAMTLPRRYSGFPGQKSLEFLAYLL
jgi:hypothetical protein